MNWARDSLIGAPFGGQDPLIILGGNGIIGNAMIGTWRPFANNSPWNTLIPASPAIHQHSSQIIIKCNTVANKIQFSRDYNFPLWVVDSRDLSPHRFAIIDPNRGGNFFDFWDNPGFPNGDDKTDVQIPILEEMWAEPTTDGHIIILDRAPHPPGLADPNGPPLELFTLMGYEMSRYSWHTPDVWATTFNVWNVTSTGPGYSDLVGFRWENRGGRGSGYPALAGMLRPEEVEEDSIRHALVFTFEGVKVHATEEAVFYWPPACRSDDPTDNPADDGDEWPVYGMLFQLDPSKTISDLDGVVSGTPTSSTIKVFRCLQEYGMYFGDFGGGGIKIQRQRLHPSLASGSAADKALWEGRCPGMIDQIAQIPTTWFRVINTTVSPWNAFLTLKSD